MAQPFAIHHSPERGKLVNLVLVGALHLGAIYTLLVALDIVPNPVAPTPPVDFTFIDRPPQKIPPTPASGSGPDLRHAAVPRPPVAPIIHTQDAPDAQAGPAAGTATQPTTPVPPISGATAPLRGIASTHTIPPYPPLALRLGYAGSVGLRISVDARGNVLAAVVETSSGHPDLDAAAVDWVTSHWRYAPATQNGQTVAAVTTAVVTFRLNQARY